MTADALRKNPRSFRFKIGHINREVCRTFFPWELNGYILGKKPEGQFAGECDFPFSPERIDPLQDKCAFADDRPEGNIRQRNGNFG